MSPKRGFEEETHPILGPLEKHARGLQEDLSAAISVPRAQDPFNRKRVRIFVAGAPMPLSLNAGVDVCLLCVYALVIRFAFGKQELFWL